MRTNLILLLLIVLSSCKEKGQIFTSDIYTLPNTKTEKHVFIKNTDAFIIPVPGSSYKRTLMSNGFDALDKSWSIWAGVEPKSMETLKKMYSQENLERLDSEVYEQFKIDYNGIEGLYVRYKARKKWKVNHRLYLPIDGKVKIIAATVNDRAPNYIKDHIKKSVLEVYIGSAEEVEKHQNFATSIPDKRNNIFHPIDGNYSFAGELNAYYYYTKDGNQPTNSPDSCWLAIRPIWNASPSKYKEETFLELLGEGFKVIDNKKLDVGRSSQIWFAQNKEGTLTALAGLVWTNGVNLVKGTFQGNFKENKKDFEKMVTKIRRK